MHVYIIKSVKLSLIRLIKPDLYARIYQIKSNQIIYSNKSPTTRYNMSITIQCKENKREEIYTNRIININKEDNS